MLEEVEAVQWLRVHCWSWRGGRRWAVVIAVENLLETRAALAMRKVTRSAGIGSASSSTLELGVPMYMDSVILVLGRPEDTGLWWWQ
jgi:hypothetical protein